MGTTNDGTNTPEQVAKALMKKNHTALIGYLLRHNPFGGYTTKTITKKQAAATLLRYEFGPKVPLPKELQ